VSVHDGDTVTAFVDRGKEDYSIWDIRLKDVFAPELKQLGGPETGEFVRWWVMNHTDGTDWPFSLETFRTPRSDVDVETLGRYVGIIRSASGASLNEDVEDYVKRNGYSGGTGS
jgi:hypothetical protein